MSKVRIINDESGEVKFVSAFVANQPDQLKQYGFRVEDLNVKEVTDNLFIEEQVIERKKPGPKPKIKEELTDNL